MIRLDGKIEWWTEMKGSRDFHNVYLCWWVRVGAMGQRTVIRTLIGKARPKVERTSCGRDVCPPHNDCQVCR